MLEISHYVDFASFLLSLLFDFSSEDRNFSANFFRIFSLKFFDATVVFSNPRGETFVIPFVILVHKNKDLMYIALKVLV